MENSYALVTGASSGMGLEYVRQLAQRGYNVIIAALPGTVESVAEDMKREFPDRDFVPVGLDLAQVESAEKLVDTVREQRPGIFIEVLVNNAGLIRVRHYRSMSVPQIEQEILLHNVTTAKLCRILLPEMKERRKGYVLNVSSLAAWLPYPFISLYSATKAFNRTFTKALRIEYRKTGVKVATVYFGAVDTPLYKLSDGKRRFARAIGVMITPQKAVRVALRMLFRGRSGRMPGFVNSLAYVVCPLLPNRLIAWIDRTVSKALEIND